jgi:putative oxidoreductase
MASGILLLRLTIGLTLAAHGTQKLFGWFGGPGLERTAQAFDAIGFQPGRRHALVAGLVEVASGVLLALGFATPLAVALGVSVMMVAAVSVHWRNGFFITEGGYEFNVVFGAATLTIAFTGPGRYSLDAVLGWEVGGDVWGLAALVVAVIGAVGQLAQRQLSAQPLATRTEPLNN